MINLASFQSINLASFQSINLATFQSVSLAGIAMINRACFQTINLPGVINPGDAGRTHLCRQAQSLLLFIAKSVRVLRQQQLVSLAA